MDRYSTHQAALVAACLQAEPGTMLELGIGYYSTPLLLEFARRPGNRLISLEPNREWAAGFRRLYPAADIRGSFDWDSLVLLNDPHRYFSVVFVDHGPAEQRVIDIRKLAHRCGCMVIHDTEDYRYGYDAIWPLFKYRQDWTTLPPYTTVVSNYSK